MAALMAQAAKGGAVMAPVRLVSSSTAPMGWIAGAPRARAPPPVPGVAARHADNGTGTSGSHPGPTFSELFRRMGDRRAQSIQAALTERVPKEAFPNDPR